MVVDTSALCAILFKEDGWEIFRDVLAGPEKKTMSTATLVETKMVVVSRAGAQAGAELETLLRVAEVEVADFTAEQARRAHEGWMLFGKGNHPAALNFGDCFSYALAKTTGEALLFKGGDFSLTDIQTALTPGSS